MRQFITEKQFTAAQVQDWLHMMFGYHWSVTVKGNVVTVDDQGEMKDYQVADITNMLLTDNAKDAEAAEAALRARIVVLAQGAVGVTITALTTAQQRVLLAVLLNKAGAIGADMTIRPLKDWAN